MVRRLSLSLPFGSLPSGSKVISDILLPMSERADTQWENWGEISRAPTPFLSSAVRNLSTLAQFSAFDGWSCVDKQ